MSDDGSEGTPSRPVRRKIKKVMVLSSTSESESDESVVIPSTRRKRMRVVSDDGSSSSSGSAVVARRKRALPALRDSDTDSSGWGSEPDPRPAPDASPVPKPCSGFASDSSEGNSDKCSICLLRFKEQEIGTPESCEHIFCLDCITEWSKNVNTCPVDRMTFNSIVVRACVGGRVLRTNPVKVMERRPSVDVMVVEDPTPCEICGRTDNEETMLLCDGCDLGYHMQCLTPPLTEVPIEQWLCPNCDDLLDVIHISELDDLFTGLEDLDLPDGPLMNLRQPRSYRSRFQSTSHEPSTSNGTRSAPSDAVPSTSRGSRALSSSSSRATTRHRTAGTKRRKPKRRRARTVIIEFEVEANGKFPVTKTVKRRVKKRKTRRQPRTAARRSHVRASVRAKLAEARVAGAGVAGAAAQVAGTASAVFELSTRRQRAGIPPLSLFGDPHSLDYFSEEEYDVAEGASVAVAARPTSSAISAYRQARRKMVSIPSPPHASAAPDILSSILESQARLHSKRSVVTLAADGQFDVKLEPRARPPARRGAGGAALAAAPAGRVDVTKAEDATRKAPAYGGHGGGGGGRAQGWGGGYRGGRVPPAAPQQHHYAGERPHAAPGAAPQHPHNPHAPHAAPSVADYAQRYDPQDYFHRSRRPSNGRAGFPPPRPERGGRYSSGPSWRGAYNNRPDISSRHSFGGFDNNPLDMRTAPPSSAPATPAPAGLAASMSQPLNFTPLPQPPMFRFDKLPESREEGEEPADLVIDTEKYDPTEPTNDDDEEESLPPTLGLDPVNDPGDPGPLPPLPPPPPAVQAMLANFDTSGLSVSATVLDTAVRQVLEEHRELIEQPGRAGRRTSDEESDGDCPNFSIYSATSVHIASTSNMEENNLKTKQEEYNEKVSKRCPITSNTRSPIKIKLNTPSLIKRQVSLYEDEDDKTEEVDTQNDHPPEPATPESDPEKLGNVSDAPEEEGPPIHNVDKQQEKDVTPENKEVADEIPDEVDSDKEEVPEKTPDLNLHEPDTPQTPKEDEEKENDMLTSQVYDKEDEHEDDEKQDDEKGDDEMEDDEKEIDEKEVEENENDENEDDEKEHEEREPPEPEEAPLVITENGDKSDGEDHDDDSEKELQLSPSVKGDEGADREDNIEKMTESISETEDERSYTPCLDENKSKDTSLETEKEKGIEGLDTEMISEEEGNGMFSDEQEPTSPQLSPPPADDGKKKKKKDAKAGRDGKDKKSKSKKSDVAFKKLSKLGKERNYRDKDRDKDKDGKEKNKKEKSDERRAKRKEKRKDLERYDVRTVVSEKRKRVKDAFGRDVSPPRSRSPSAKSPPSPSPRRRRLSTASSRRKTISPRRTLTPRRRSISPRHRSISPRRRSISPRRRSVSPRRRSVSPRKRSISPRRRSITPRKRSITPRRRSITPRRKSPSLRRKSITPIRRKSISPLRRKSISPIRRKSVSPRGRKRRSTSRGKKRRRSISPKPKGKKKKRARSVRAASKTRRKSPKRKRKRSRSPSISPAPLVAGPGAWSPASVDSRLLSPRTPPPAPRRRRHRRAASPPAKEVFTSGDNILVSVSFKEQQHDSGPERRRRRQARKERRRRRREDTTADTSATAAKPVAIIDLERSPFRELTPSPKNVIVLSDSDHGEAEPAAPARPPEPAPAEPPPAAHVGPKTPPEPPAPVKFALPPKPTLNARAPNPLRSEPAEAEAAGPSTPPESPDAYDPFEPTRSPSASPAASPAPLAAEAPRAHMTLEAAQKTNMSADDVLDRRPLEPVEKVMALLQSTRDVSPEPPPDAAAPAAPAPAPAPTPAPAPAPAPPAAPRIVLPVEARASAPKLFLAKPSPIKSNPVKPMQATKISRLPLPLGVAAPRLDDSDSPYSPGSSDFGDLFEPAPEPPATRPARNHHHRLFDKRKHHAAKVPVKFNKKKGKQQVGVKIDEDNLKILDDLPSSAVEMQVKSKFLKKLNRQERVVEEVKLVLKPHYNKKHVTKDEYKDILRRAVPKICHNKSGEINPTKIQALVEAYVKKFRKKHKLGLA